MESPTSSSDTLTVVGFSWNENQVTHSTTPVSFALASNKAVRKKVVATITDRADECKNAPPLRLGHHCAFATTAPGLGWLFVPPRHSLRYFSILPPLAHSVPFLALLRSCAHSIPAHPLPATASTQP